MARADPISHVPAPLPEIIDRVLAVSEGDTVSVADITQSVGRAGFAALLLIPALAVATPLSGIPFFSALMGMMIVLVSVQMLARRRHLWLPAWLLRKELNGARVRKAFTKVRPVMQWIEDRTRQRLKFFVQAPLNIIPQGLCVLSGMMMPLLEFVPFSSSVMGIGVVFLTLGMLTRDGVVAILALVPYAGVAVLVMRIF